VNTVLLVVTAVMATAAAIFILLCWFTIRQNVKQRARSRHRAETPAAGTARSEMAESR
jgi:hypothetical protein